MSGVNVTDYFDDNHHQINQQLLSEETSDHTSSLHPSPDHVTPKCRRRFHKEETLLYSSNELHRAVENGDLNSVELVLNRRELCFQKDGNGRTPLHVAAQKGRIDVVKSLLLYCPESVKEVINVTSETCLHTAVIHCKAEVVQYLLNWIEERHEFFHVLNLGDSEARTALHLSASRKQLQILRVLLSSKLVDVNALNSSGCTALDILYVLPYSGKIDKQIDCMLRQAGAMRSRDLINKQRSGCHCRHRSPRACNSIVSSKSVLLVIATLVATVSYLVTVHLRGCGSGSNFRKGYAYNYMTDTVQMNKQVSAIPGSVLLFNSMTFLTALSMVVYLLREFPLKPWPQISVSFLFVSYICSVMAESPGEALALLFLSVPFLGLAATGRFYGFPR